MYIYIYPRILEYIKSLFCRKQTQTIFSARRRIPRTSVSSVSLFGRVPQPRLDHLGIGSKAKTEPTEKVGVDH